MDPMNKPEWNRADSPFFLPFTVSYSPSCLVMMKVMVEENFPPSAVKLIFGWTQAKFQMVLDKSN